MAVFDLIEKAFRNEEFSDHKEQFLVEKLRKTNSFIPELSLLATIQGKIVGYILLTKIKIIYDQTHTESLALAPVAILPEFQGKGIGGMLIEYSHKIAKSLGFTSVVVLGHQDYYPRFGYKRADKYGIELPFDFPKENCMVIELIENGLDNVHGKVQYAKEFFE